MAPRKNKYQKYDEDKLLHATAAVRNNSMTIRKAADHFGVPHSTLGDRVKLGVSSEKPGRQCKLSERQEHTLVNHLLLRAELGNGATRNDIRHIIKDVLDKAEEHHGELLVSERLFPENLPPRSWIQRFMKRHPNLSARTPENLGHLRKNVTELEIRQYFNKLEEFLIKKHHIVAKDFFVAENGNRIFNLDESGFPLGPGSRLKIVTGRGNKNVYAVTTETKEQITVLCCASADGSFEKPYIIFPGVRPTYHFKQVDKTKYIPGCTASGWITTDSFFGWFSNHFIGALKKRGIRFPIVVFMDGHTSHINMAVIQFCKDNDVILFCFPSHASHILQPLDVSVFGPLKQFWNKAIEDFKIKFNQTMTRANFITVFDEAFERAKGRPANVISGFRKCGIVPFNQEAIDYSRLINAENIEERYACREQVSTEQRVGMIRSYQMAIKKISKDNIKLFEKRYKEGYDIQEDTVLNELWNCYKILKQLTETKVIGQEEQLLTVTPIRPVVSNTDEEPTNLNNSSQQAIIDLPLEASEHDEPQTPERSFQYTTSSDDIALPNLELFEPLEIEVDGNAEITMLPMVNSQSNETSTSQQINLTVTSPVPGPSWQSSQVITVSELDRSVPSVPASTKKYYDYYPDSPFKTYLKISDDLIVSRKPQKTKPAMPPAVTSEDYETFIKRKQDKKQEEEDNKKKRKEEREKKKQEKIDQKEKKSNKGKAAKRLFTGVEESAEEQELHYDDDDDDDLVDLNVNQDECPGCESDAHKNNPDAWMGCNYCPRWYHKSCFDGDYESLTHQEIEALDFKCDICLRIERTKKKNNKK